MFADKTEQQARAEILSQVAAYCKTFHNKSTTERISYAGRVYDENEMTALVDAALEFWLTSGRYTKQFETGLADYIGVKYCSMVNSGSSANLLAFAALTSPLLGERQVRRGDEVITVAAGFPTTIAPIIQYGCIPVFVDITIPQYNIDCTQLENAVSKKTKAVFLAHTLGNPFDIACVKAFCDKYNLWLIEDNCDALGSVYEGQKTGTFGHIATSSFYPPHHMTTGEGGAVYTDNPLLHKIVRSMRDWGRDCVCDSGQDNYCGHRFDGRFGDLPHGYDHKYVYSHLGYNLKATDMQAAIGVAQLKKLPSFVESRRKNFSKLAALLQPLATQLILPKACENAEPSWFGFIITATKRPVLVSALEQHNIQTRMLFAGNITKHPCFSQMREGHDYRITGTLSNTDRIMTDTFWIGVYPGMTDDKLEKMANVIRGAL